MTVVDAANDEVRIAMAYNHVVYLKRAKDETYDAFVQRVTKYCEDRRWQ